MKRKKLSKNTKITLLLIITVFFGLGFFTALAVLVGDTFNPVLILVFTLMETTLVSAFLWSLMDLVK